MIYLVIRQAIYISPYLTSNVPYFNDACTVSPNSASIYCSIWQPITHYVLHIELQTFNFSTHRTYTPCFSTFRFKHPFWQNANVTLDASSAFGFYH